MQRLNLLGVSIALLGLLGCSATPPTTQSKSPDTSETLTTKQPSGPSDVPTEFINISDPVENCFTVDVPKDWHNRGYSSRAYDIHREVVTCVSPNSDTVLFLGDPNIPQYWAPNSGNPFVDQFCDMHPLMELSTYQSAEDYFPKYATKKFGKLTNFKITGVETNEELLGELRRVFAQHGFDASQAAVVDLKFSYEDEGKTMNGLIIGSTINSGGFWMADVYGISTSNDVETYRATLLKIARSKKTNPEWTALQNQKHEERMAQMRAHQEMMNRQHAQNMQWIQNSAQRHQQRMQAIWAANDASMQSYYDRSASSDLQHQRFLNTINEESTVVGSSGEVRQVDNSYQRYYINKSDNTYVGGDIRFNDDSIRKLGLNPDDYEEAKVRP